MFRMAMLFGVGVLSLAFLVGAAATQDKKEKGKGGQLPPGWKDLDLSATQREKVYDINREYKAKIDELSAKIKMLESERNRERVKVLTDDQRAKLARAALGEDTKKKDAPPKKKEADKE